MTAAEREDLLERAYAAFNDGDVQARNEVWTEDLVWHMMDEGWPGPTEYRGLEGLWQFREDWFGAWETPGVERLATEHLPDVDRTLVHARTSGSAQGMEFELIVWQLAEFRNGRIARVDEGAARKAAGLE